MKLYKILFIDVGCVVLVVVAYLLIISSLFTVSLTKEIFYGTTTKIIQSSKICVNLLFLVVYEWTSRLNRKISGGQGPSFMI